MGANSFSLHRAYEHEEGWMTESRKVSWSQAVRAFGCPQGVWASFPGKGRRSGVLKGVGNDQDCALEKQQLEECTDQKRHRMHP